MMNPGSNYVMMKMRQRIAQQDIEIAELKETIEQLKASGAKAKPKKLEIDEAPKKKPVVKKLDLDDEPTIEKE